MTVATDNRDLVPRRQRLGLSQQDIADLLCGFDITDEAQRGKGFHFSAVSRFETGAVDLMPARARGERRFGRADYEALLDAREQAR